MVKHCQMDDETLGPMSFGKEPLSQPFRSKSEVADLV